jgi:lipoate-protein ligase B
MRDSSIIDRKPIVRHLGRVPYLSTWQAMQRFTDERTTLYSHSA